MKNFYNALSIAVFALNVSFAQNKMDVPENNICGTETPSQQWEAKFQESIKEYLNQNSGAKALSQVYTIPVIIHVIHGGQSVGTYPNLAQAQLKSQIQVLNNDYGGIGYNSGNYPSTAFANFASTQSISPSSLDILGRVQIANCNIQFCLATKDTLGNVLTEQGIERINYVSKGWTNPGSFTSNTAFQNYVNGTIKPQTIWNVSKYLNIWVTDIGSNATLLGYATFPPFANLSGLQSANGTSTTDGFWCRANAFGSQTIYPSGTYLQGYTRGRTSTHEIGHYLGLRHTWGDGVCATDYCTDTPPNKSSNFGSPIYPLNATGTNSCAGATDGSMFMNFMDYTNDPDKYMFTNDQAIRIQTAMSNSPYRKFLGTHNLCSLQGIAASSQFNLPTTYCGTAAITLTNTSSGVPVPTFTWSSTGGASFSPNNSSFIANVNFPTPGTYTITLSAGNGTIANSSKIITIYPKPNLIIATPTLVCIGDSVIIAPSGGNSYAWLPQFVVANSVRYLAAVDQSYTVTATDSHGCKTIDSISIFVTECVGINSSKINPNNISIYPNPSNGRINLKFYSEINVEALVEIFDPIGKLIYKTNTNFNKDKIELPLNIESAANGIYIVKIISSDGTEQNLKLIKE